MAYYPHPPQGSKSQWFLDGEGIEYRVIQADISLYLGCDATVTLGYGPDVCIQSSVD